MFNSILCRYELFKLGNYEFTMKACKNNKVKKLEWLKNSEHKFEYNAGVIYWASLSGHVQVLEWFKHSGYEFKYNAGAINWASFYGHVQVLEWFKQSGYKFKYDEYAIMDASNNERIQVLKWLVENIPIKKVVKWSEHEYVKTIKFKTKKQYFKGYEKN